MDVSVPKSRKNSRIQALQSDLHSLCSGSFGEVALRHFVSEASCLLELDTKKDPGSSECSAEELEYLISCAKAESEKCSSMSDAPSSSSTIDSVKTIDPKFFSSLRRIVSDKEGDKVLMKGLQSLPYVKVERSGNTRERRKVNSRKYEEDLSIDELSTELSEFVDQVVEKGDLRAYLVLLKVILCLWEDLDSTDTDKDKEKRTIIDQFSVKLSSRTLKALQTIECVGRGELQVSTRLLVLRGCFST